MVEVAGSHEVPEAKIRLPINMWRNSTATAIQLRAMSLMFPCADRQHCLLGDSLKMKSCLHSFTK